MRTKIERICDGLGNHGRASLRSRGWRNFSGRLWDELPWIPSTFVWRVNAVKVELLTLGDPKSLFYTKCLWNYVEELILGRWNWGFSPTLLSLAQSCTGSHFMHCLLAFEVRCCLLLACSSHSKVYRAVFAWHIRLVRIVSMQCPIAQELVFERIRQKICTDRKPWNSTGIPTCIPLFRFSIRLCHVGKVCIFIHVPVQTAQAI